MGATKTLATTRRVLNQLRHDPQTLALLLVVPCVLMVLLKYIFEGQPRIFNQTAPLLLGIFPLFMMFLVTSITTLRERTTGTLDRLMTQPIAKTDLLFGYAIAFALLGLLQAGVVSLVTLGLLGVTVMGGTLPVIVAAVLAAFLGTALGLLVSAFARNEFQAVELVMPILMPQVLLSGLFVPREQMATLLQWLSNVFPLSYSVDALRQVATHTSWTAELSRDLIIVAGVGIVALMLGSLTVQRQD